MSDITINKLEHSESGIETEYHGAGLFVPRREICLTLAQRRSRTWPWYYSISFGSREAWFEFVRFVNECNRAVKKAPRDEAGFPVFDEKELKEWKQRYETEVPE